MTHLIALARLELVLACQRITRRVHVITDPMCIQHWQPPEKSRLDQRSRGTTCQVCADDRYGQNLRRYWLGEDRP